MNTTKIRPTLLVAIQRGFEHVRVRPGDGEGEDEDTLTEKQYPGKLRAGDTGHVVTAAFAFMHR